MFPGYEKDKHYINVTKSFPLKTIFNHFEEHNQTTKTMIVYRPKWAFTPFSQVFQQNVPYLKLIRKMPLF